MKNLHKTLAVLTLAATGLGLAQAAQAGDRLTIIYSNSGHHALPSPYGKHWPVTPLIYGHSYGHSHHYRPHEQWCDQPRHRHDNRWSRLDRRDRRHEEAGWHGDRHDSRKGHSAYAKGDRY